MTMPDWSQDLEAIMGHYQMPDYSYPHGSAYSAPAIPPVSYPEVFDLRSHYTSSDYTYTDSSLLDYNYGYHDSVVPSYVSHFYDARVSK